MREGFYKVEYQGETGLGFAVIALETGIVVGADFGGGIYDGTYKWNEQKQLLETNVTVQVPEGVPLVQGHTAGPGGCTFEVKCSFPREPDNKVVDAISDLGTLHVRIYLLRAFT